LFDKNDFGRLERWRNDFRFCACPAINGIINDNIQCGPDHADTKLQQQCTEHVITDQNTVRCELARKKRSTDNVIYRSRAPRQTDNVIYMIRTFQDVGAKQWDIFIKHKLVIMDCTTPSICSGFYLHATCFLMRMYLYL